MAVQGSRKAEEPYFRTLIVGGGTAGIALAARMRRENASFSIGLIEPNEKHYYQSAWTLVGANAYNMENTARPTGSLIPPGVTWIQDYAASIDPEGDTLTTRSGNVYHYAYLVVCPGVKMAPEMVEGLPEALEKGVACSAYIDPQYTRKTLQNFKGGTALFTQPTTPVKSPSATQQIMYLADELFAKNGVRDKISMLWATPGNMMFPITRVNRILKKVIDRKDIGVYMGYELVAVDPYDKVAWYELDANVDHRNKKDNIPVLRDGVRRGIPFDLLHVTPPQQAPDFIRQSPLSTPEGWVPVNKESLQHTQYKNVFSLGDVAHLPTGKNGDAIRHQVPVVSFNLRQLMLGETLGERKYRGNSGCALATGYGKALHVEYRYKSKVFSDSFWRYLLTSMIPNEESRLVWALKKYVCPYLYWNVLLKGR